MADTIDVFGKPVKKSTAAVVGIGAAVVVGIAIMRARKNSAAAAAATSTTPTDQSQIDQATGFLSGSPEDLAALQALDTGSFGVGTGLGIGGTGTVGQGNPQAFTSNAQWAQAAEQFITGSSGGLGAGDAVGNALGKYITGGELSVGQVDIVNQAIAFENYPPVAGPDGYPPAMRTAPVQPPPHPSNRVQVPNVLTMEQEEAFKVIQGAGLKVTGTHPVHGKILHVESESPKAGTTVSKGSTVHLTSK